MLRLVDERYRIDQVAFEPPTHAEAIIARGNRWRSKDPHDHHKVTALVRTLATKIAEDVGFVMFHMDGDCPWSRREDGQNRRQWNECDVKQACGRTVADNAELELTGKLSKAGSVVKQTIGAGDKGVHGYDKLLSLGYNEISTLALLLREVESMRTKL